MIEAPPFATGSLKRDSDNTRDYLLRLCMQLNEMEQEIKELKVKVEGGGNSNGE